MPRGLMTTPTSALLRATPLPSLLAWAGLAHAQGVPAPEVPDAAKSLAFAHAQVVDAPEVPDAIKVQPGEKVLLRARAAGVQDRKSTRLNSSHRCISYAV